MEGQFSAYGRVDSSAGALGALKTLKTLAMARNYDAKTGIQPASARAYFPAVARGV